mmetsp:Transcript_27587/g.64688  ORF Transcript_27587/g.64688 Transcript_27587/m.64688 type:complete len:212 (+) Transcript_27587:1050-1685(+)
MLPKSWGWQTRSSPLPPRRPRRRRPRRLRGPRGLLEPLVEQLAAPRHGTRTKSSARSKRGSFDRRSRGSWSLTTWRTDPCSMSLCRGERDAGATFWSPPACSKWNGTGTGPAEIFCWGASIPTNRWNSCAAPRGPATSRARPTGMPRGKLPRNWGTCRWHWAWRRPTCCGAMFPVWSTWTGTRPPRRAEPPCCATASCCRITLFPSPRVCR